VVKFGNRSVTSVSGSFDFLDCLGIPAHFPPEKISELLEQTGLVFLYAPQYYPALKTLAPIRKQVGVKTVFNFIGPLLNPVQPAYRLLGVSSRKMQHIIADYLVQHPASSKRSWVIHSPFTTTNRDNDLGLDEFSLTGQTRILSVVTNPGQTSQLEEICFDAQDLPETMKQAQLPDTPLSPANSAKQLMAMATGADRQSACYQLVCLNAAAGFCVAGHTATILSGIELAQELMASGAVLHQLTQCRRAYERISGI
jgi:anthranilate phosphoribosyltransferase